MKEINKKIMSLLLSGALVSVPSVEAKAINYSDSIYDSYNDENKLIVYYMNGIYTTIIEGKPMYVYLGNSYQNEYFNKQEAIRVSKNNYEDIYFFSKTKLNPNYVEGITPYSEKNITVYAISGKEKNTGWTRVKASSISDDTCVATTIDLGEFLLKGVDLTSYKYNMVGYAYVDFNRDGKDKDLMYLGNGKLNTMMSRNEAIRYCRDNGTYIVRKRVVNPKNSNGTYVYAISGKKNISGWKAVSREEVPLNATVLSNIEYVNVIVDMLLKPYTEEIIYNYIEPSFDYSYMKKDDALSYAYSNYSDFCILSRKIVDPRSKKTITIYSFSFTPYVEGWEIIGNDYVPKEAFIFLTLQDAIVYESELNYNYGRVLK